MTDSAYKKHRPIVFIIFISILLLFSIYYLLNSYFNQTSLEILKNWYNDEIVYIQQGQILSSVTKLQRSVETSAFLKGVLVTDKSHQNLVMFGAPDLTPPNEKSRINHSFYLANSKFFATTFAIDVGDLTILINFESLALKYTFVGLILYLIAVIVAYLYSFGGLIRNQEKLKARIEVKSELDRLKVAEDFSRLSLQVAHDIRSPLSALEALVFNSNMPIDRIAIIENIIKRIKQVSDDLLRKSKTNFSNTPLPSLNISSSQMEKETFYPGAIVLNVVEEKNTIIPFQILAKSDSKDVKVNGNGSIFSRIISNILENSIAAVANRQVQNIEIEFRESRKFLSIFIKDNGVGIPANLLSRIGEDGFTFGKPDGNGLGISFSRKYLNLWGGSLTINSSEGTGTIVLLNLSKV